MILEFGSRHHLSTEGLTPSQLDTLTVVSDEIAEHQSEMEKLAEAYKNLLEELKQKNVFLKEKDDQLYDLKRDSEGDNQRFRDRMSRALGELQAMVDSQAADLASKDSELQLADLDKATLNHKIQVLQTKADELEQMKDREIEDLRAELKDIKQLVKARNEQLYEKEGQVVQLESGLKLAEDSLQRANHRADNAERCADRAVQDLKLHKSTSKAEVVRQTASLDDANSKARQAILGAQQERSENVQLVSKLNSLELVNDELAMDRARLDAENRRLRQELDATRKVEGDLQVELRKLELINNQKDAANGALKHKLQERQRGLDNERESVDQLADAVQRATDRLKRANDHIDKIFINQGHPDSDEEETGSPSSPDFCDQSEDRSVQSGWSEPGSADKFRDPSRARSDVYSGRASASPRVVKEVPYEPAVLPDEVDRVECVMDQLSALMEVHGWEKTEDKTKYDKDKHELALVHKQRVEELECALEELKAKWEEEKARAEEERTEKARLQKMMQFENAEGEGRRIVQENEEGEWSVISSGMMAAKAHYLSERLDDLEYLESEARLDVEDLEDAEYNLMMQEADEDYNNVIEILRKRRIREFREKMAKVRKTAYMGIEVSDGITIRHREKDKVGKLLKDGKAMPVDIEGVKVFNVAQNGPADLAGIASEDIITQFNSKKVRTLSDFKHCAKQVRPGDVVHFTVWRDGMMITMTVQTVEVNEEDFEQGVRRKIGHRITVMRDSKAARNKHREARRQELRQSQQQMKRVQLSDSEDEEEEDEDVMSRPPSYPPSRSNHGSPLGLPDNSAATHTLAGANAGPMTNLMFNKARKGSVTGNYNELEGSSGSGSTPSSPLPRTAPKKTWQKK